MKKVIGEAFVKIGVSLTAKSVTNYPVNVRYVTMDTGIVPVKMAASIRIVKSVVCCQENAKCAKLDFGEETVRIIVETVRQISVEELMDGVLHANPGSAATIAPYPVILKTAVTVHVMYIVTFVLNVNMGTGEPFVQTIAVRIVRQAVVKAMDTVVTAERDSGEIIVINFVHTTVHHQAVLEQQDTAAAVRPAPGVCIVTRRATMVVLQAVT